MKDATLDLARCQHRAVKADLLCPQVTGVGVSVAGSTASGVHAHTPQPETSNNPRGPEGAEGTFSPHPKTLMPRP